MIEIQSVGACAYHVSTSAVKLINNNYRYNKGRQQRITVCHNLAIIDMTEQTNTTSVRMCRCNRVHIINQTITKESN